MLIFETAATIINDVAAELGLIAFTSKVADPFSSTDPNLGQLCQQLKTVGRRLLREHRWSYLTQTWTFSTVANTGRYALPTDYDRFIASSAWNRTNRLPLGGPLSATQFQALKARLVGVVYNVLFQVLQQQFQAYPDTTTPGGYTIAYGYVSRWWVLPQDFSPTLWTSSQFYSAGAYVYVNSNVYKTAAGGTSGLTPPTHTSGTASDDSVLWTWVSNFVHASSGTWQPGVSYSAGTYVTSGGAVYKTTAGGTSGSKSPSGTGTVSDGTVSWTWVSASGLDAPTAATDLVLFDPELVREMLKAAFLGSKGMPADDAKSAADIALDRAIIADVPGSVLNLGARYAGEPLLGQQNIPETGFGS